MSISFLKKCSYRSIKIYRIVISIRNRNRNKNKQENTDIRRNIVETMEKLGITITTEIIIIVRNMMKIKTVTPPHYLIATINNVHIFIYRYDSESA